jgi:hypothetical protein
MSSSLVLRSLLRYLGDDTAERGPDQITTMPSLALRKEVNQEHTEL